MDVLAAGGHVVVIDDDVILPEKLRVHQQVVYLTPSSTVLRRWLLDLKVGDRRFVVHVNKDFLDCRRENLAVVTRSEFFTGKTKSGSPLPKNVRQTSSGRYVVQFMRLGVQHRVPGCFDTVREAVKERNKKFSELGI